MMKLSSYLYPTLLLILVALFFGAAAAADDNTTSLILDGEDDHNGSDIHGEEEEEGPEPADAVLFPSFCVTIGIIVFYVLTRYVHVIPYTAIMFAIGTLMGIGSSLWESDDHINTTIRFWTEIDSEVLLLVFLPGLIFKDSIGLNVHLFRVSLGQSLIFAFPMVLAGTTLTALVAYYVFPYNWSFNLCMTFGSIMSATDPVAVAALLNEVGAPPRLKVHVAGEALLNDGAAIVFYSIFVQRYLFELMIPGLGEDIDLRRGIALFCRKALGGVAIGIFFGLLVLFVLYKFDRRFSREENIVEVTATMGLAYLGYYVSDFVWATSGVISTVTAGVVIKFLGRATINDATLLEDFWTLVEHILNTVLFTLGGAVWGAVLVEENGLFEARDWGYLILIYVVLTLIRALLFTSVYPIISRIGLKTSWQETVFQIYGGLRGAVGIALALSLDNEVGHATNEDPDNDFRHQTRKLFGMVGGIAFLTLVINASTAGPLLRRLGLTDSTATRSKIVGAYRVRFRMKAIEEMLHLLTQKRFCHVNFALVKEHVPHLADLTKAQLLEAIERQRETTQPHEYKPPHLDGILPYLKDDEEEAHNPMVMDTLSSLHAIDRKVKAEKRKKEREKRTKSTLGYMMQGEPLNTQEFRVLYISILKAAYERQTVTGELQDRHFLTIALEQSLELANDAVSKGEPLQDWDFLNLVDNPVTSVNQGLKAHPRVLKFVEKYVARGSRKEWKRTAKRMKIERSLAFMVAHHWAQEFVAREFENAANELSEAGKLVISESKMEHAKAEAVLLKYEKTEVQHIVSHKFCSILLNSGIHYVGKLVKGGLLKDEEAEHWVEEIEEQLHDVLHCKVNHVVGVPGGVVEEGDEEQE